MEKTAPCHDILDATLKERLGDDFFTELTSEEVVKQLVLGDNDDVNVYQNLCDFIEKCLLPPEGASDLIFAPTTNALRFYRTYLKKQLADVLFVGINDPTDPEAIVNKFTATTEQEEAKEKDLSDTQFERYKQAQDSALAHLIGELKQLKRESMTKTGSDLQVVFSDVKEAPAHFQLIQDHNPATDEAKPSMASLVNPTIRFLRFGHLYNERTKSITRMGDALQSPDIQRELTREEDNIYTLKYRPGADQLALSRPIESFVRACMTEDSKVQPHMESATEPSASTGETSSIPHINRENFKAKLDENKLSVIAVFARRCQGCRELEPKLPELKRMLEEEIGGKKVGVVKMDIYNEVHFLKHVEKTPSFLLHEKKGNYFWDLQTSDFEEITKTADRIYKKSYRQ